MAWIKMRTDLFDDPAVIGICAATGLDGYAVIGRLEKFWGWADGQTYNGNAPCVTGSWVDRYLDCNGFAAALVKAGWLEVTAEGINLPNFERHNGETAKSRALTAKRVQKTRAAKCNVPVTPAPLPEKRREEKSIGEVSPITPPPLLPLPTNLNTIAFWAAWADWLRHLDEKPKNKRPTPTALQKQIAKMAELGSERAVAAITRSIEHNWQSIFEENVNGNGTTTARGNPRAPADARRTAKAAREYPEDLTL